WPAPFEEIDRRRYGDTVIGLAQAGGRPHTHVGRAQHTRSGPRYALMEFRRHARSAMTIRALLLGGFLMATSVAGSPQGTAFVSGVWQGEANYDSDGNFGDCTMCSQ